MNLLKAYFHYMEHPAPALEAFVAEKSFSQACVGYLAAALGWVLFFNIGAGLSVAALLAKWIVLFAAEVTAGYFLAAVCALYLDFARVKVSAAEMFCLLGTAGFINGLLMAMALLSAAWPAARLGVLAPLGILLVWGLKLGYLTRGLMRLYQLPAAKALGAWLFTAVPLCAVAVLGVAFFVWGVTLLF